MPAGNAATATLAGKRVLITRAPHQADALARGLRERGAEPIFAPTIAIEPPDDPRAAHRAIDEIARYAWIVFTSQNAVDAFFDRLDSLDADARYLGGVKVAAIGEKTAKRLKDRGVRSDLVPALYVGEEIARALEEAAQPHDRILLFRAQEARDVLPTMLEEAGLACDVVAAYKTVAARDPDFGEKVARADAVTFASASGVAGFVSLLGGGARAIEAARGKAVACIGPVTAQAARDAGLRVDAVAGVYTSGGLIDALEAHFALGA